MQSSSIAPNEDFLQGETGNISFAHIVDSPLPTLRISTPVCDTNGKGFVLFLVGRQDSQGISGDLCLSEIYIYI